ncbi:MAG: PAS domain-containing sensor histidine kinase [Chloroflexota bacterium]
MQLKSHKSIDLETKAEWLETILNTTTEGFIILDLNGSVKMSNQPADNFLASMTGEEPNNGVFDTQQAVSIIGYKPVELIKLISNIRRGNLPEDNTKIIPVENKGTVTYLERRETTLKDADSHINGLLIVFRDVTEQVEREEWQREFTGMVVHDLKNPVSTLYTGFEWMRHIAMNEDTEMIIENGRRVSQQLLDMIDSLLDMARMEAGRLSTDLEAINVGHIAHEQLDTLLPLSNKKQIKLSLQVDPNVEPVWGDRSMVRRVIANLVDNALKFTPAQGQVSVVVLPDKISSNTIGDCRIMIADTGKGVPTEDRERIFSRFEMVGGRGKSHRGTGIGLSFCKQAIEAMGGQIWVEDNPGGGSRFVFTLPGIPLFEDLEENAADTSKLNPIPAG